MKKQCLGIKITSEDKMKDFLLQKMMDSWITENPGLLEDIQILSSQIVFFNLKWGTKITSEDLFK